ncbi:hypothetical protein DN402_08260 [Streptomyces sp. SW4]|nr:hypothetical protein DN402_08260 [Streptomyces sp. SW4]
MFRRGRRSPGGASYVTHSAVPHYGPFYDTAVPGTCRRHRASREASGVSRPGRRSSASCASPRR